MVLVFTAGWSFMKMLEPESTLDLLRLFSLC